MAWSAWKSVEGEGLDFEEIRYEKKIHSEDISADSAPSELEVPLDGTGEVVELEVRLDAIRNCEPWSWGDASKLWIESVGVAVR